MSDFRFGFTADDGDGVIVKKFKSDNGSTETADGDASAVNQKAESGGGTTETAVGDAPAVNQTAESGSGATETAVGDAPAVNQTAESGSGATETADGDAPAVNQTAESGSGATETADSDASAVNQNAGDGQGTEETGNTDSMQEAQEVPWIPKEQQPPMKKPQAVKHNIGRHSLFSLNSTKVEGRLIHKAGNNTKSNFIKALSAHSDLVAGQYEGGLRVWECSMDLCHYMAENVTLEKTRVLELGCGAGLPGMLAARMGAASVHFQDFNKEVLETYTMQNIIMNDIDDKICTFFAGDWESFATLVEQRKDKYDVILTAETIYNVKSYPKLLKVFSLLLEQTGYILLAAKNDYFGVGGGVLSFTQFLQASQQFAVETVRRNEKGLSRLILKLTRSDCASKSEQA